MTKPEDKKTKGVKNLLGEPKRAILKLSVPMMFGMFMQSLYNVTDGIFVAGLGANQLAAVGLFFPFFMMIIAINVGIGTGGSSFISRKLGAENRNRAENGAEHTLLLGLFSAIIMFAMLFFLSSKIFPKISGSESVGEMAVNYSRIISFGLIFIIFSGTANAIIRAEGDSKKAMLGLIVGSLLNVILDPIFIYGFKMGVQGAAIATIISAFFSSMLFIYWIFFSSKTYLKLNIKKFSFDFSIIKGILKVGLPASLSMISMSSTIMLLNFIVVRVGGNNGVAVLTSGWRILMIGAIPLQGLAAAVTVVTAAAYGAKRYDKLKIAYIYSLKIGFIIEAIVALSVAIFAEYIAKIFSWSGSSLLIRPDLILFLRITSLLFITIPFGMLTSAMFSGIGKGLNALAITIFRTLFLQVFTSYYLAIQLNMGLEGVWIGLVSGNFIAVTVAFIWGKFTIANLSVKNSQSLLS